MIDSKDFLVEIGTEELPPKALPTLIKSFAQEIQRGLDSAELSFAEVHEYAAPRRLAVWVEGVATRQADKQIERRGPAVAAAFDAEGNPSKAAQGFARSCGVEVDQLARMETAKGSWLCFRAEQKGASATDLLPEIVSNALAKLPIPKRMRWGSRDTEFVRPVHWVILLQDNQVIPAQVMGITADNKTRGHRFHHPEALEISQPARYAEQLKDEGYVIADFSERRATIRHQVETLAMAQGGTAVIDAALLDEVTALVEWPVALAGKFDEAFLDVPHEALIATMQDNQKYFPLVSASGGLMARFITVANIESSDPETVIEGNERVIRPRFSDAVFFWEQDRKQTLASRVEALKTVLFQKQLGTLYDKTLRIQQLAAFVATQIGADQVDAERAAWLSKCDLLSDMVNEFPKLQGIAGRYYAQHDGEAEAVALALDEQYLPRHAGDDLPAGGIAQALAIADKIDTVVGIFGIGQKPSGTRDPFGLRRASLGILRILIEKDLDLDLKALIEKARSELGDRIEDPDVVIH
ncbi:MAG TPA: glycine--tRNA ligase subunit beta, partial [Gammaproteobacteria bacterium]|nr:glycine--tRNA ligase subunit beta [Gammaproteobacteria bacterium]